MKRCFKLALITALAAITLIGCGKSASAKKNAGTETSSAKESSTTATSNSGSTQQTQASSEVSTEGKSKSNLTGEWIDSALSKKRPLAVMIENTAEALPQYGTSKADVIYEVPVEGAITRLMAVYQDYSGMDKIGNIRSCRPYYVDFASEWNAIYVHYGENIYAFDILKTINDLDGLNGTLEQTTFFRTTDKAAPHNAYMSSKGVDAGIKYMGYSTDLQSGFGSHYQFTADKTPVTLDSGTDATVVAPGYYIDKPWFVYHKDDGLYYRYEFKQKQMDAMNNQQITTKNIILQNCSYTKYDTEKGYLNISAYSGGAGEYITNGKQIPITWKKASQTSPTKYYDSTGKEITINQGKTWVCVILNDQTANVKFYKSEDEFNASK